MCMIWLERAQEAWTGVFPFPGLAASGQRPCSSSTLPALPLQQRAAPLEAEAAVAADRFPAPLWSLLLRSPVSPAEVEFCFTKEQLLAFVGRLPTSCANRPSLERTPSRLSWMS